MECMVGLSLRSKEFMEEEPGLYETGEVYLWLPLSVPLTTLNNATSNIDTSTFV